MRGEFLSGFRGQERGGVASNTADETAESVERGTGDDRSPAPRLIARRTTVVEEVHILDEDRR
jgi:hypothetical protein